MRPLKIGADPELFCKKDGQFISAHGMVPGTKHNPHFVDKGAVQLDGVAAEFNINPAFSKEEFLGNIDSVIKSLEEFTIGTELVATPTALFEENYFNSLPDGVKVLGCEPDYNAYTGEKNRMPHTTKPFRTGAGHIHVGFTEYQDIFDKDHFEECALRTKQLDHVLYVGSLLWDSDNKRRELYGSIGSFRVKPYGVEYRPLSNAFLSSDEIKGWVYDATVKAMELFEDKQYLYTKSSLTPLTDRILNREAINKEDVVNYMQLLYCEYGIPELNYSG